MVKKVTKVLFLKKSHKKVQIFTEQRSLTSGHSYLSSFAALSSRLHINAE